MKNKIILLIAINFSVLNLTIESKKLNLKSELAKQKIKGVKTKSKAMFTAAKNEFAHFVPYIGKLVQGGQITKLLQQFLISLNGSTGKYGPVQGEELGLINFIEYVSKNQNIIEKDLKDAVDQMNKCFGPEKTDLLNCLAKTWKILLPLVNRLMAVSIGVIWVDSNGEVQMLYSGLPGILSQFPPSDKLPILTKGKKLIEDLAIGLLNIKQMITGMLSLASFKVTNEPISAENITPVSLPEPTEIEEVTVEEPAQVSEEEMDDLLDW